jgi:hypothetical protein
MIVSPEGTIDIGLREVFLAGTTLSLTLSFTEVINGSVVPVDIDTATSAYYKIYDLSSNEILVTLTLGAGILIDGNSFVITVDPDLTEGLAGDYGHEFKWKSTTGRVGGAPGRIRVVQTRITEP